jgi:hypothetical protein
MFIAIAFQLHFIRCCQEGARISVGFGIEWNTSAAALNENISTVRNNTEVVSQTSRKVDLEANAKKTKYIHSCLVTRILNKTVIMIANKSLENVANSNT